MSQYTLQDLEKAQSELMRITDKIANDSSNNPNKYESDRKSKAREVLLIEGQLKTYGVIEMTDEEKLTKQLDELFPDARSKQIITHNGKKYQKCFSPAEMSRSRKNVMAWNSWWKAVS